LDGYIFWVTRLLKEANDNTPDSCLNLAIAALSGEAQEWIRGAYPSIAATVIPDGSPNKFLVVLFEKLCRRFLLSNGALIAKSAFALALYGLLRMSEFTSLRTLFEIYPDTPTCRIPTIIAEPEQPSVCHVPYPQQQNGSPWELAHIVTIHATGQPDCPVAIFAQYLQSNRNRRADLSLFVLGNGNYLTRGAVTKALRGHPNATPQRNRLCSPLFPHWWHYVARCGGGSNVHPLHPESLALDAYLLYLKLTPTMLAEVHRTEGSAPSPLPRSGLVEQREGDKRTHGVSSAASCV